MNRKRTLFTTGVAAFAAIGLATAPTGSACPVLDHQDGCEPPPPSYPTKVAKVGIVNVADGYTLGVRYIPRQKSTQYRQLPDGGKALIVCQTRGGKVSGTYGTSRIWNRLKNGGWVSDAYVYTGSDGFATRRC